MRIRATGFAADFLNEVTIVDGQSTELSPRQLIHGATISGFVRRAGAIVSGASVQLSPTDANQLNGGRQTRADDAGHFVLENVEPGSYQLSATRPNSNTGDPFEAIGDLRRSQLKISLADGEETTRDLGMSEAKRR